MRVTVLVLSNRRRTVDSLLADLLAEVGLGLGDVALTLEQAREQPEATSNSSLVSHLLAVESFDSFRRLSTRRPLAAMPLPRTRVGARGSVGVPSAFSRPSAFSGLIGLRDGLG